MVLGTIEASTISSSYDLFEAHVAKSLLGIWDQTISTIKASTVSSYGGRVHPSRGFRGQGAVWATVNISGEPQGHGSYEGFRAPVGAFGVDIRQV